MLEASVEEESAGSAVLSGLFGTIGERLGGEGAGRLRDWIGRELDRSGLPRTLPREEWDEALRVLASARALSDRAWPARTSDRVGMWARGLLAFRRPDGSGVWSADPPSRKPALASLRAGLPPASSSTLLTTQTKQLPSITLGWDEPLVALRDSVGEAWLALDHRAREHACRLEFGANGKVWMGPTWGSSFEATERAAEVEVAAGRLVGPIRLSSVPRANLLEWSWRDAGRLRSRTIALLGEQSTALFADLVEGDEPTVTLRFELPADIEAIPASESRAIRLLAGRGRGLTVVPLGLPAYPGPTDRGSLVVSVRGGKRFLELTHTRPPGVRRIWLPLAVTWRTTSAKRVVHWRTLTVSERSRPCAPGVAFAARLAWERGPGENLLIYKSLARAGTRAFLGFQTRDRYVIASFASKGETEPIVGIGANE